MGANVDHRADLYSLAVVVFEMVLGQTPFHANTHQATLMAHANKPVPRATELYPEIEPGVDGFFSKALAKRPDARFQSAIAMVEGLTSVIEGGKVDVFDDAGEARGYIGLGQADILAMQTARDDPGNYGKRYSGVHMAFEGIERR